MHRRRRLDQQGLVHRLDGNLLTDVLLDLGQGIDLGLAGKADGVAFGPRRAVRPIRWT